MTSLPIIVKGILRPDDAELAIEHKVSAIIVSNHGGRQLDGVQAAIDALPAIVKQVNRRCEVFVDGGFYCGTDVIKALAIGANMVKDNNSINNLSQSIGLNTFETTRYSLDDQLFGV